MSALEGAPDQGGRDSTGVKKVIDEKLKYNLFRSINTSGFFLFLVAASSDQLDQCSLQQQLKKGAHALSTTSSPTQATTASTAAATTTSTPAAAIYATKTAKTTRK